MESRPNPARAVREESLQGDLIKRTDPLFGIVWVNPERMWGAPCFFGTRVPVRALFDYLRAGRPIEEFLDDFPGVTRGLAVAVLDIASERFLPRGHAA